MTTATPPVVVFLTPIAPAATGNGLAMRAGMLLDALADVATVHLVVVPVSGPVPDGSWTVSNARSVTVVPPVDGATARAHLTAQLADRVLRDRLDRTAPLPARATLAPPTLVGDVLSALGDIGQPDVVVALRTYLAPLGVTLARDLDAGRIVIDADDDDAALMDSLGYHDEARAFERLARCWLPDADAVFTASSIDAASLATRAGLDSVSVVPNAVAIPESVAPAPDTARLLFVGNLTYEPNRKAARLLVEEILPRVREHRADALLDLVGPHDPGTIDSEVAPGVRWSGWVEDVAPFYAASTIVVVPLRHGGGTRIKILEAFAHRRPVVATRAAVGGLDVAHDRELLLADDPDATARSICLLLDDRARARNLAAAAAELVASRYSRQAVAPLVRSAILGADTVRLLERDPTP